MGRSLFNHIIHIPTDFCVLSKAVQLNQKTINSTHLMTMKVLDGFKPSMATLRQNELLLELLENQEKAIDMVYDVTTGVVDKIFGTEKRYDTESSSTSTRSSSSDSCHREIRRERLRLRRGRRSPRSSRSSSMTSTCYTGCDCTKYHSDVTPISKGYASESSESSSIFDREVKSSSESSDGAWDMRTNGSISRTELESDSAGSYGNPGETKDSEDSVLPKSSSCSLTVDSVTGIEHSDEQEKSSGSASVSAKSFLSSEYCFKRNEKASPSATSVKSFRRPAYRLPSEDAVTLKEAAVTRRRLRHKEYIKSAISPIVASTITHRRCAPKTVKDYETADASDSLTSVMKRAMIKRRSRIAPVSSDEEEEED